MTTWARSIHWRRLWDVDESSECLTLILDFIPQPVQSLKLISGYSFYTTDPNVFFIIGINLSHTAASSSEWQLKKCFGRTRLLFAAGSKLTRRKMVDCDLTGASFKSVQSTSMWGIVPQPSALPCVTPRCLCSNNHDRVCSAWTKAGSGFRPALLWLHGACVQQQACCWLHDITVCIQTKRPLLGWRSSERDTGLVSHTHSHTLRQADGVSSQTGCSLMSSGSFWLVSFLFWNREHTHTWLHCSMLTHTCWGTGGRDRKCYTDRSSICINY